MLRARVDDFDSANRVVIRREKKRSKDRETFRSVELTPFLERVVRGSESALDPAGETGRVDLGVRGITHDRPSYVW